VLGLNQLVQEARLAHAWLTDDRYDLSVAGRGQLLGAPQMLELRVASDELREAPPRCRLEARSRKPGSRYLEDFDRDGEPLHGHRAERLHGHVAFHQRQRRAREENASGPRQLLHARGQVRGLADGGVVHVQIAADRAHDDLARVEPHLDLHVHAVLVAYLLGVLPHQLLHPERGEARPHGVVFLGERRSEERHDPIAHHLVHRALVVPDGLHHALEQGVEDLAGFFRIAVGEELHGGLHVGEQHRHVLALCLQRRTARTDDLLGRIRGPIGGRRRHRTSAPAQDLLVERRGLLLGLGLDLASQCGRAQLILAQGGAAPSGLRVELHQCPVRGLLQRIQGEKPERGLDRRLDRSGRTLVSEETGQNPEGHLVQALALGKEPVFERRLLDREPLQ
jgi:hypothetical protein